MSDWAIETQGLTKGFGRVTAVKDLNLEVKTGSIFGFLGPNGAGKTTTIKLLVGLLRPSAGRAWTLGAPAGPEATAIRQRISYVSETQNMYNYLTVAETVAFCRSFYSNWDDALVRRYLDLFDLPARRQVGRLSKGMRTLLALVLAIAPHPELLILDEPTGGLDPLHRREFLTVILKEISAQGSTVFFSSHILSEVDRVVDHVAILSQGHLLVSRSLDEMKTQEKRIRVLFSENTPADLAHWPGVRRVVQEGSGYLISVAQDPQELAARLTAAGGTGATILDMNLEEIFLDYIESQASERTNHRRDLA